VKLLGVHREEVVVEEEEVAVVDIEWNQLGPGLVSVPHVLLRLGLVPRSRF
jgi:hypothetical protein